MTEPRGDTPMDADGDLTTLVALDRALDELAAGRDAGSAGAGDEAAALAAVAAELRAAVPAPPPAVAEHGRTAFLARAAAVRPAGRGSRRRLGDLVGGEGRWRRSRPVRVVALAAALVLLMAVPAAVARQARPGTALWPMRQAGQQVRLALAADPVERAHLRLNTAQSILAAGAGAGEERRKDLADQAEDQIKAAQDGLRDLTGLRAAAERSRAERLLVDLEALEDDEHRDDRSGPGSGTGEDRSGGGGGGSDDDRRGSGGGEGSGSDDSRSGSGSSGSGSGSGGSGSGRSGSGVSGHD